MTSRKIDWGYTKPMTDVEKKCANQQQYAVTCVIVITGFNIMYGALMVYKVVPVWLGMILAFLTMGIVALKARRDLLDEGETLTESPEHFRTRMHQKNLEKGIDNNGI